LCPKKWWNDHHRPSNNGNLGHIFPKFFLYISCTFGQYVKKLQNFAQKKTLVQRIWWNFFLKITKKQGLWMGFATFRGHVFWSPTKGPNYNCFILACLPCCHLILYMPMMLVNKTNKKHKRSHGKILKFYFNCIYIL
jgi:hypothetical protein